jgi:hypothetical protein
MDPPSDLRCQGWNDHSAEDRRCINTGIRWVEHICTCGDVWCTREYHLWECQGPCTFAEVAE